MTLRLTLAALAIAALPGLASAQCMHERQSKITASSCVAGTVFDAATGTCKAQPSS